ncbi:MAG TPA: Gfo/Idh/MocA family oxidoreductase [Chitinophagaceae bacterium]|nr:Gfo/Idh/MocA family oxidoreductase [Chitinophagaceae bacterium]
MNKINWGIIGCGDVTELKSGPAFNKVKNSSLVAVMRRDAAKAKDYAQRHNVPKWYDEADQLISDPGVNAIYVATPPSSHEEYTIAAIKAGKPVYVEKPMSVNFSSAKNMMQVANEYNAKLVVAHYRRAQPLFKKIKELLNENAIGDVRIVNLICYKKSVTEQQLSDSKIAWRVNPLIAGGGLFNDLAPHQLDLMIYFFGEVDSATGIAANQAHLYNADDVVAGSILFKSGVMFNGTWCFTISENNEKDVCEIIGTKGKISFAVFDHQAITLTKESNTETISFDKLLHVQQPMIEKTVAYFLNESDNPCSGEDGVKVMELLDEFTQKSFNVFY